MVFGLSKRSRLSSVLVEERLAALIWTMLVVFGKDNKSNSALL